MAASPAAQHRTALLLGCKLAHPLACGLFSYSFLSSRSLHDLFTISSRSLNERVCQNDNWTNSAKMASCACFVKLTLRACSVKWPLPVCCCCRLFSPAACASSSATAPLPAASSRWNSAATPWLATVPPQHPAATSQHGAPPSNKPHPAERSTPVRLAIWRTWAGFANSQLRCANFSALIYIYASILIAATLKPLLRHSKSVGPSAPIAYATSVSPPDEAVTWPWAQVSGAG